MTQSQLRPIAVSLPHGMRRTYKFLLNEGGWWSAHEMQQAFELSDKGSLHMQLRALLSCGHIARKGTGNKAGPYLFGVLPSCKPVPGITLETSGAAQ